MPIFVAIVVQVIVVDDDGDEGDGEGDGEGDDDGDDDDGGGDCSDKLRPYLCSALSIVLMFRVRVLRRLRVGFLSPSFLLLPFLWQ